MKSIIVLALVFMNTLLACSGPDISVPQIVDHQSDPAIHANKTPAPSPLTDDVVSRNYAVANSRAIKAIMEGDKAVLKAGLKSIFPDIKTRLVEAIAETNDQQFVDDLVSTLKSTQDDICCGTEATAQRRKLSIAVVIALKKLTHLDLRLSTPPADAEIEKIIVQCSEWWAMRKSADKPVYVPTP